MMESAIRIVRIVVRVRSPPELKGLEDQIRDHLKLLSTVTERIEIGRSAYSQDCVYSMEAKTPVVLSLMKHNQIWDCIKNYPAGLKSDVGTEGVNARHILVRVRV